RAAIRTEAARDNGFAAVRAGLDPGCKDAAATVRPDDRIAARARIRRQRLPPHEARPFAPQRKPRDKFIVRPLAVPRDGEVIADGGEIDFVRVLVIVRGSPLRPGRNAARIEPTQIDLGIAVARVVPARDDAVAPD